MCQTTEVCRGTSVRCLGLDILADLDDNLQNLDRRLTTVYDLLEELARSTTISEADWNIVQDAITQLEGV